MQEQAAIQFYQEALSFQEGLLRGCRKDDRIIFRQIGSFMNCCRMGYVLCDTEKGVDVMVYDREGTVLLKEHFLSESAVTEIRNREEGIFIESKECFLELSKHFAACNSKETVCISWLKGNIEKDSYGILLCHNQKADSIMVSLQSILFSSIKQCVENYIYYCQVTYESEHDILTKLYNRRCYFRRCEEEYRKLMTMGIFSFDVNNLKAVNDRFGHAAGDFLLKKAAQSFYAVMSESVHAYRMGGDEFLLVVMNKTREDMQRLKLQWEISLKRVNEIYGGEPCVVAVGSAFGEGAFAIEELCCLADKRMYKDKLQKKKEERK